MQSFPVGPLLFPSPQAGTQLSSWEARLALPLHEPLLPLSWPGAIWSPGTPGIPVLCRSRNGTAPVWTEKRGCYNPEGTISQSYPYLRKNMSQQP